ncbi:MAG: hypothetical protein IPO92_14155 [Saprospiraceae bacterium]|nr:hypothetical protein [Saprospiraceae bacterium]
MQLSLTFLIPILLILKINEKYDKQFISKFDIVAYPTCLYLNKNGEVVEKIRGYAGIEYLFNVAKSLNKGQDLYKKDVDIEFDEQEFINNLTKTIAPLSPTQRKFFLHDAIQKGKPYSRPVLLNFESLIDIQIFLDAYKKLNGKSDLLLTESLMLCHLLSDHNFKSNELIRDKSKTLSQDIGFPQNKILAYILAYREIILYKQLNIASKQSLIINSKSLLKHYPETKDMDLLIKAFIEVVREEKDVTFYAAIEDDFTMLANASQEYLYYDMLSIIHYAQDKKEACTKDIAKANDLAYKNGIKYDPLYKKLRKYLDDEH